MSNLSARGTAPLGKRNLPRIGLGCMGMSEFYGPVSDDTSLNVLLDAFEVGVRHFDTADMYGRGHNERLVGTFLKRLGSQRKDAFVATKVGICRSPENPTAVSIDSTPEYIRRACDDSLGRLGVERIDLLYLHRRNANVPIEESIGAMKELVQSGKVQYLGLCEVSAATLESANTVSPITALQSEYSLWTRDLEVELLDLCDRLGVAVVAYSPLGRGFLTGAITKNQLSDNKTDLRNHLPRFQGENFDANLTLVEKLASVARKTNCTPAQLALAWVLAQRKHLHVIPGVRSSKHLRENFAALTLDLQPPHAHELSLAFGAESVHGDRYPPHLASTLNT